MPLALLDEVTLYSIDFDDGCRSSRIDLVVSMIVVIFRLVSETVDVLE